MFPKCRSDGFVVSMCLSGEGEGEGRERAEEGRGEEGKGKTNAQPFHLEHTFSLLSSLLHHVLFALSLSLSLILVLGS